MVLRAFGGGHDWYPQYSIGSMPVTTVNTHDDSCYCRLLECAVYSYILRPLRFTTGANPSSSTSATGSAMTASPN